MIISELRHMTIAFPQPRYHDQGSPIKGNQKLSTQKVDLSVNRKSHPRKLSLVVFRNLMPAAF